MNVLLLGIESHKQDEVRSLHNRRATLKHAAVALATMRNHGIEAWGCFIINPDWVEQDFDDRQPTFGLCTKTPRDLASSRA